MALGGFGTDIFGANKFGGIIDVTVYPTGVGSTTAVGSPVVDVYATPTGVSCTIAVDTPLVWLGPNIVVSGVELVTAIGVPNIQLLKMPFPGGGGPELSRFARGKSLASHARKTDGGEEDDIESIILLLVA